MKKKIFILSSILFALLSGVYIFQVNSMTAMAHGIATTQDMIDTLRDDSKALEIVHVQNSSFASLEELAAQMNFEKITHVVYSQIESSLVAQGNIE